MANSLIDHSIQEEHEDWVPESHLTFPSQAPTLSAPPVCYSSLLARVSDDVEARVRNKSLITPGFRPKQSK